MGIEGAGVRGSIGAGYPDGTKMKEAYFSVVIVCFSVCGKSVARVRRRNRCAFSAP